MMLRLIAAAAVLVPGAARAQDRLQVTGGTFFSDTVDDQGNAIRTPTDRIANRPGESCYGWQVDFRPQEGVRTLTERLILPAPAAQWGGVDGNPESPTSVTPARNAADTAIVVALPTGIAAHGWCVAEGDPIGDYRIEVLDGTRMLRRFDFIVEESLKN